MVGVVEAFHIDIQIILHTNLMYISNLRTIQICKLLQSQSSTAAADRPVLMIFDSSATKVSRNNKNKGCA
jgi:hypothetical protein